MPTEVYKIILRVNGLKVEVKFIAGAGITDKKFLKELAIKLAIKRYIKELYKENDLEMEE